jgi:DNA-binding GntR family transcriptional regulator
MSANISRHLDVAPFVDTHRARLRNRQPLSLDSSRYDRAIGKPLANSDFASRAIFPALESGRQKTKKRARTTR